MTSNLTGIVCIDGANATGKTTLAEELRRRYGAVVLHQTYRFKEKIFDYHTAALRLALRLAETKLVVLDRLWMSEVVYARLYRIGTPWSHQGRMVDRVLQRACAVQVICSERDPAVLEQRYRSTRTSRTDIDVEKNSAANSLYRTILVGKPRSAAEIQPPTYLDDLAELAYRAEGDPELRYDLVSHEIGIHSIEQTCNEVEHRIRKLQSSQLKGHLRNDNFLGGITPHTRFLFAGDTPNTERKWSWPFYEYGYSSLYLTRQLHVILFDESTAIWTNVNDPQHNTLAQLLKEKPDLMGRIKVIALGNKAGDTLKKAGVKFAWIPHPQYGNRFDSLGSQYRPLLQAALGPLHPTFLRSDQDSLSHHDPRTNCL